MQRKDRFKKNCVSTYFNRICLNISFEAYKNVWIDLIFFSYTFLVLLNTVLTIVCEHNIDSLKVYRPEKRDWNLKLKRHEILVSQWKLFLSNHINNLKDLVERSTTPKSCMTYQKLVHFYHTMFRFYYPYFEYIFYGKVF